MRKYLYLIFTAGILVICGQFLLLPYSQASEILEKNFSSGGHQFHVDELSTAKYPFKIIEDNKLLLITHSSDYWDNQHITWKGIELLTNFFRNNNLPLFYLAEIQERSTLGQTLKMAQLFYPPGISESDIYPYQGDSHRIIMRGHHVVIAGGNFTICACNTVRSIVALSESESLLHIHYAMSAIYEGQHEKQYTLQEISDRYNDQEFLHYLESEYFNQDTLPCQDPTLIALDRRFNYSIYRDGHFIGNSGDGKNQVILHFEKTEKVIEQMVSP